MTSIIQGLFLTFFLFLYGKGNQHYPPSPDFLSIGTAAIIHCRCIRQKLSAAWRIPHL